MKCHAMIFVSQFHAWEAALVAYRALDQSGVSLLRMNAYRPKSSKMGNDLQTSEYMQVAKLCTLISLEH